MEQLLQVDIRTVLLLMSLGNMAAAGLLVFYGALRRNTPEGVFTLAKLVLGPGWLLLLLRGYVPDACSFGLGNGLLMAGFWLEAASIKVLDAQQAIPPGPAPRVFPLGVVAAAMLLGFLSTWLLSHPGLRIAATSTVASGCFALSASRLFFGASRPSPLRLSLGAGFVALTLATLGRTVVALTSEGFTIFSTSPLHGALFALLYTLMFAGTFGLVLVLKENTDRTLVRIATQDELTGAPNRRALLANARALTAMARREGQPLAAFMLDIDRFKQVNDTFGHATGDEVLRDLARVIRNGLRTYDAYGRYGGEEFVAVLPGLDRQAALRVAERIRASAEASQPTENPHVRYTVSIGVALCAAEDDCTDENERLLELLDRADQAMYEAKRLGRNRVQLEAAEEDAALGATRGTDAPA
ncbi:diguanylate cyclase (GGDEF) domain-containing protein [Humidesulfovibrio mexicanus]|uniref:diguanylate cyclase n=1 Tax=Humidesulfovibrio mexicanus TaxID=147047 RepID=A0A239BR88_9BACT|nr:GGDEF domain-containing protein [Humidesulfovibrio mexicanus]SNS09928.1 diguanylate cyclase (GGDEF) domain-containing protein [Humidesulfovibrio mexicanus]